jgi:hypothetical protein
LKHSPVCKNGDACAFKVRGDTSPPVSTTTFGVLVHVNVYEITPINDYVYRVGLGICHSAMGAPGAQPPFGAHDYATSGVSELEPKPCPRFIFLRGLLHGTTDLTALEFRVLLANAQMSIVGTHTHPLIARNCNHFSDDVCQWLMGSSIPRWINNLAQTGHFRNCLFTESVQVTMMKLLSFEMGENTGKRWWEVRVIEST